MSVASIGHLEGGERPYCNTLIMNVITIDRELLDTRTCHDTQFLP